MDPQWAIVDPDDPWVRSVIDVGRNGLGVGIHLMRDSTKMSRSDPRRFTTFENFANDDDVLTHNVARCGCTHEILSLPPPRHWDCNPNPNDGGGATFSTRGISITCFPCRGDNKSPSATGTATDPTSGGLFFLGSRRGAKTILAVSRRTTQK